MEKSPSYPVDIQVFQTTLKNTNKINIIMGKNGSGKSTLLQQAVDSKGNNIQYKYISPERGGILVADANIANNIHGSPNNIITTRKQNQLINFKRQTFVLFETLERNTLRKFEKNPELPSFQSSIDKINTLLTHVKIERNNDTSGFHIIHKQSKNIIKGDKISSGESELITLAIEVLVFSNNINTNIKNILLLDEPDTHLHPDLQVQFMKFLWEEVKDSPCMQIIISTHSTAILSAFSDNKAATVAFTPETLGKDIREGTKENILSFQNIQEINHDIIPIFGAHPLSRVFNESPILIVEGEDDSRIWQQVTRSSQGKINFHPCVAENVSNINKISKQTSQIIQSIYDDPIAYALRDGDGKEEDIEDEGAVIQLRMKCYEAENMILSDEVLEKMGVSWEEMKNRMDKWIETEEKKEQKKEKPHKNLAKFQDFQAGGYDRKMFKIKKIRNDIMYLAESGKSWEVIIGQTLAENRFQAQDSINVEGSIFNFLGEKAVKHLFINQMK
ncbi:hypothetical protein COB57_01875 [Candidatus Peregrinibacteria bacterium]|nr:MAG: hypothetical protein COB57_01875 [Candidatus Peregrinibacteria bacterium]